MANGFYTAGGLVLTFAMPWGRLPPRWRWLRLLAWAAWLAGCGLSLSAQVNFVTGLVFFGAALIVCFVPFAFGLGLAER